MRGVMQDLNSTDPTQGTCRRSHRLYGSHQRTWAGSYRSGIYLQWIVYIMKWELVICPRCVKKNQEKSDAMICDFVHFWKRDIKTPIYKCHKKKNVMFLVTKPWYFVLVRNDPEQQCCFGGIRPRVGLKSRWRYGSWKKNSTPSTL